MWAAVAEGAVLPEGCSLDRGLGKAVVGDRPLVAGTACSQDGTKLLRGESSHNTQGPLSGLAAK